LTVHRETGSFLSGKLFIALAGFDFGLFRLTRNVIVSLRESRRSIVERSSMSAIQPGSQRRPGSVGPGVMGTDNFESKRLAEQQLGGGSASRLGSQEFTAPQGRNNIDPFAGLDDGAAANLVELSGVI
jgi:hypothetical protein